jgi:ribulose-5-phosphate 4-epimerase/fuculose-1-phosphate aldolase
MKKIPAKSFRAFAEACHRAAGEYGLMKCSSGNMSWRVDAERMLVTATRTWLADIRPNQIAVLRIRDGKLLNDQHPSVESGFHAGVLRVRPDMNVVLHFQSPFATTLACRQDLERVNFFSIPEVPYYIGPVAVLPYILPGSEPLARAVIPVMAKHDMVVLRNHGMVTVGADFNDAIQKAVFFELACEVIVRAGTKLRPLTKAAAAELLRAKAV